MKTEIILASYNGEKYIETQIRSFFNQTVLPDRLIIGDDGSDDKTIEIVLALKEEAPFPIEIIRNKVNLGYTKNFENLLSKTTEEIIFFSDQDDYWFPNKIERALKEFSEKKNIMVVINDMILTDSSLSVTPFTQLRNIRKIGMSDESFVAGCAVSIRRSWNKIISPFPENYEGHDNWINRLATITNCRAIIETPLQYYRRHDSNVSQSFASKIENVSHLQAVYNHGLESAEKGWLKELSRITLTEERLKESKLFFINEKMISNYNNALNISILKKNAYNNRIENVRKNRLNRLFPIVKMLLSGQYSQFAGFKSFVKDIIRTN